MLEDLQEKYFDEVRTLLPLHRMFLFTLGFIAVIVSQKQTHKSIVESLLRLDLKSFSFDAGNLLETAQIWHALVGASLVFLGWATSRFVTRALFKFLLKKIKTEEKLCSEKKKIQLLLSKSRKDASEQLPYFEKQSEIARKKVIRAANFGELFIGVFICFMGAIWFGNVLDLIVSLTFLVFAFISTYIAVFLFYSKYLKFDLLRSVVSGVPSELEIPSE